MWVFLYLAVHLQMNLALCLYIYICRSMGQTQEKGKEAQVIKKGSVNAG
jgi:hypothetical protein